MIKIKIFFLAVISFCSACNFQLKENHIMKNKKVKNMSCDIETGICSTTTNKIEEINLNKNQKVKLIYYTDPICSACWTIEPELKRFMIEYGDFVDIEYKMGGLLPGWEGFSDAPNGISSPKDVAIHWNEVGQFSGMSIDGDIWLEDPLSSSYPPSIAFKAMQKQGEEKALKFLRNIREMVFLEKKNITREEYLIKAAEKCGGDIDKFLSDYHNPETVKSFYEEIQQGREMGVRGFPTFIFIGRNGMGYKISGTSGYENYVLALEKAFDQKLEAKTIPMTEEDLLNKYGFLASKEISFVLPQNESITLANLEKLAKEGRIQKVYQKYGLFWRSIK